MGKSSKSNKGLAASAKAVDPALDALFSSSSGPVKAPSASRYSELLPQKEKKTARPKNANGDEGDSDDVEDDDDNAEGDDEVLSELDDEEMDEIPDDDDDDDDDEDEAPAPAPKDRKRKRKDEHEDLEDKYMRKLAADDEDDTPSEKRLKGEAGQKTSRAASSATDAQDEDEDDDDTPIVHESLAQKSEQHPDVELDKANRTLFLGNVASEAISSSKAKKTLEAHLKTPLADLDAATGPHKIESLRFRSTAFSTGAMPKRAAYITKNLMSSTTKSTNAYVVYSTPLAARTALRALNGTTVLDRHLRVDSVAHPTPIAHRRCVFVGNLGFVDDETVVNTTAEGETTTKKRHKVPSDIEEGLWRTFEQHAGKVESVRVPRDSKTRVGKGFAYVQFYETNDVESALLLDGKKFPPMIPRALRVSRAKDPRKTTMALERTNKAKLEAVKSTGGKDKNTKYKPKATPEQQSLVGRAEKLFGRGGAAKQRRELNGDRKKPREGRAVPSSAGLPGQIQTPEQIVFEGRRASSRDGKPRDLKFGKGKGKKGPVRPKSRGAKRAAEWKKKGGSK